jgi:putative transposase
MGMANRFVPLIQGEVYHVYNRGAHKADVFTKTYDYERFQLLMHACNTDENIKIRTILEKVDGNQVDAFSEPVDHLLVDVLGYCLMKNHVHMIVRPKVDGGLQKFMQKLMTGYSMYSNKRYEHSGTLWEGRFKAKHVDTDAYLWQLFAYIHVNPIEYIAKFWKADKSLDKDAALAYLNAYYQSSLTDFYPTTTDARPHAVILSRDDSFTAWLRQFPKPKNLLEYYLRQDFSAL